MADAKRRRGNILNTPAVRAAIREISRSRADVQKRAAYPEVLAALKQLREACNSVAPLAKKVPCKTVSDVRFAMKWLDACDAADAAIAKAEGRGNDAG